jgi:hypothetical protein
MSASVSVERAAAARLHNELRPIHFINRGNFTSTAINLQVLINNYKIVMFSKRNFQATNGSRSVGAMILSVSLRIAGFAELLREGRSVSSHA